ncbi:FAD-dependent oxidoreductase [Stenotrophomonas maltophilia]|nr:FAD-dependent oxidoreductase [Stenotrophomonas maltophilia]MBH1450966.1 FAD-dependent oxidoreductase [Stenotrophomonas maltophilia]MBK5593369.1 FAD-dependent oxidoreductase [Stenotrophomonas maltophilia]MBN5189131.1 FAD-dependent oxidoreductase [Stenotrophomonas maltophilia]MCU1186302.1 FAD-dependent oxidoreductase [Stenotrophomonas maltophilia]
MTVRTRLLGLYGVDSPLPTGYLDDIAQRREGHEALEHFLDIFNHRIFTQFYRIWRKYSYPATFEPGGRDATSQCLLGLIGLGIPGTAERIATPMSRFLALLSVMRLPEHLVQRVANVRLYAPNLRSVLLAAPGYYFLTTDTPNLMRWLASELRANGVDLRLRQSFTDAHRSGDGWQVEGAGRCAYLVGADGARSRVAQRTSLGQVRDTLYGVEREFAGLQVAQGNALHRFVSKRYAPGYIGWVAQNPTGLQVGLALRHDPQQVRPPDIDGFLDHVRDVVGIPPSVRPSATRAGLVPCGRPDGPITGQRLILTGDAAGIVSPLSAGGIHSSWRHGWAVGEAIARHLRGQGPEAERVARRVAPAFHGKRLLRWAMDHLQADWPLNALLHTAATRRIAEQVYFHRRGLRT